MFVAINSLLSELMFSSLVRVVSRTTLIRPELAGKKIKLDMKALKANSI